MEADLDSRGTVTQREQSMVLNDVNMLFNIYATVPPKTQRLMMELQRENHVGYLLTGLQQLGPSYCSLDANRPWICYWILHSIALLGESIDVELEERTIDFLSRCQDPNGGYGGGPGQLPHLATTYAAVHALISLGGDRSLSPINRIKMYTFLKSMKDPSGAFRMHDAGEIDVRACYTAISVASILNILDDELVQNVGNYILSCQTYEGGIAGEPGSEAHGGYTFCGLATMILINEVDRLDLTALIEWVVFRQGVEGGFQGRTNKLVDGCYSFWQGGVLALLQRFHSVIGERPTPVDVGGADCRADNTQTTAVLDISGEESSVIGERPTLVDVGGADCRVDNTQTTAALDISEGEESSEATSSQDDEECHFQQGGSQSASCRHAEREPLFHSFALQRYILLCSQVPGGGLRDKLRKPSDYYHTCYCLSGLSVCQHSWLKDEDSSPLHRAVLGPYSNVLEPIHPIFNIVMDRYHEAHEFFLSS